MLLTQRPRRGVKTFLSARERRELILRPPDSAVLVIREGYVRLDGWCSRAHVSSRMVSRASELVNLLLIQ